jgi:hypothetical protein
MALSPEQRDHLRQTIRRGKKKKGGSLSHIQGYRRGTEGAPRGPSPFSGNRPTRQRDPLDDAYRHLFKEYKRRKRHRLKPGESYV